MVELTIPENGEYLCHADGVMAVLEDNRVRIVIAEPMSRGQVLALAGALWEVWAGIRCRVLSEAWPCELHVREIDEVSMPLANVFSMIERELHQTGSHLVICEGPMEAVM